MTAIASIVIAAGAQAQAAKAFELGLVDGKLPGSAATLRVKRGERVELRWSSDRPIALHLHGYDIEASVTPQAPATMSFGANLAGRFPVSEHGPGHHRAIVYLEVHP